MYLDGEFDLHEKEIFRMEREKWTVEPKAVQIKFGKKQIQLDSFKLFMIYKSLNPYN